MLHIARLFVLRIGALLMVLGLASAQSGALASDARPRFDQSALDAMIAPIALYPDQLLTQVLMAATYPEEVDEAARWSRARPGLSGDAAVRTADGFDWDPSVRSLTAFPQVLDTMAQHMAWTQDLGHAFVVQPQDVMDTVQRLRFRAYEAGTLASNDYTRVIHTGSSIVIESIRPQVVYVPYYDSRVAYGRWWWPASPPMVWPRWYGYHELYGRPSPVYWGPGIWLSSGFFFGGFDWPRREVRVVNPRPYYYAYREHRPVYAQPHVWRHDDARREVWRQRVQPTEGARAPAQRGPQLRQEAPATGALAPRQTQPQADGGDFRDRRARRVRDPDGDNETRVNPPAARANVNPATQQQPTERAAQGVPQVRQAPATGALAPNQAQPDANERRVRRSRDSDGDADGRAGASNRAAVGPAPQPRAANPAVEAPRPSVDERERSRPRARRDSD